VTPILISHRGLATLGFRTSFAGITVACDAPWPGFAADTALNLPRDLPELDRTRAHVAQARGWLGQRERGFELLRDARVTRVADDADELAFECVDGQVLRWQRAPQDEDLAIETLLGAGLVMACSDQGRFCLHASAVRDAHGVWIFLGASGAGKSTLARELAAEPGFERVADDIVPVIVDRDGARALPRFPQLKLAPEHWWPQSADAALPIRAVTLLQRGDHAGLEPLSSGAAQQALIAHTAGTRLFDAALLAQHLAWCAAWVRRVPCLQLTVPQRPNDLRGAAHAVAQCLQAAAPVSAHCV
jgi:hypothetical protein